MCYPIYEIEDQEQSIVLPVYNPHYAQQTYFPSSQVVVDSSRLHLEWEELTTRTHAFNTTQLVFYSALQGVPFEAYLETASYPKCSSLLLEWHLSQGAGWMQIDFQMQFKVIVLLSKALYGWH
uniref:Uncharacterized protein n=1 Tax=Micrurus surinamensis TaxID=129470 RepID=A0A2D4PGV6_MICSU